MVDPPFLRLRRGHAEIDIGIDGQPRSSTNKARVFIDPETGEPKFDPAPSPAVLKSEPLRKPN